MTSHRATKRRTALSSSLVVACAGVLIATSAGSAVGQVGTDAPGPRDCTTLIQVLITAQVAKDSRSAELQAAEKADVDARAARDQAVIDATKRYRNVDRPAAEKVVDDPKTEANETAVALQAALDKRDKSIAAAQKTYVDGGTADRLVEAKRADRKALEVLGVVRLDLGKACVRPPAQPPVTRAPLDAPLPTPVETHLPVTH